MNDIPLQTKIPRRNSLQRSESLKEIFNTSFKPRIHLPKPVSRSQSLKLNPSLPNNSKWSSESCLLKHDSRIKQDFSKFVCGSDPSLKLSVPFIPSNSKWVSESCLLNQNSKAIINDTREVFDHKPIAVSFKSKLPFLNSEFKNSVIMKSISRDSKKLSVSDTNIFLTNYKSMGEFSYPKIPTLKPKVREISRLKIKPNISVLKPKPKETSNLEIRAGIMPVLKRQIGEQVLTSKSHTENKKDKMPKFESQIENAINLPKSYVGDNNPIHKSQVGDKICISNPKQENLGSCVTNPVNSAFCKIKKSPSVPPKPKMFAKNGEPVLNFVSLNKLGRHLNEEERKIILDEKKLDHSLKKEFRTPEMFRKKNKMIQFETGRFKSLENFNHKNFYSNENNHRPFYRCSSLVSLTGSRNADNELENENDLLRTELQETKDHAELLEFRILELTEGNQEGDNFQSRCDRGTNTEKVTIVENFHDDFSHELLRSRPFFNDKFASSNNFESDADLQDKILELRKQISNLEETFNLDVPDSSFDSKNVNLNIRNSNSDLRNLNSAKNVSVLKSLLNYLSLIIITPDDKTANKTLYSLPKLSPKYKTSQDIDEIKQINENSSHIENNMNTQGHQKIPHLLENNNTYEIDLAMLATKLEESLFHPHLQQDDVLKETIYKLRKVDLSLTRLKSRVNSLSNENKELQDALNTLNDSHETRTEASGTESELVRKTPSIHSDLSDTESDDSKPSKVSSLTSSSYQESGIFVSACETFSTATQTYNDYPHESYLEIEDGTKNADLQSAFSRLSSIKKTVNDTDTICNLRNMDIKNKDFSVENLDSETILLSKMEYDAIVTNERNLQREIEALQCEKNQILSQNSEYEEQIKNSHSTVSYEEFEVMKAELRLLDEKLEISERRRIECFDEKCEIEEAENDSRLMSQRLESQLDASREMESLLSASLKQEQEFCRELQRRVRDLHEIDKARLKHEENLEREIEHHRKRSDSLSSAKMNPNPEIVFALYGIVLSEFWRRNMALKNPDAIVPYSDNLKENYTVEDVLNFANESSKLFLSSFDSDFQSDFNSSYDSSEYLSQHDAFTQTHFESLDLGQKHSLKVPNYSSLSNEEIYDREQFYISQIETLQKERKRFREDYENEKSYLLDELQSVKNERNRVQNCLEESQREKCKLLFKLEEAKIALTDSEMEKEDQVKELKREYNHAVNSYLDERKSVQLLHEKELDSVNKKYELQKERFDTLLHQYSILQHELEPYFESSGANGFQERNSKNFTTKEMLSAVRELIQSENMAKTRLKELEKKESAYRETINEADRIMSNHVTLYTQRIEDLEAKLEQKSQRIQQLEMSEERLRSTMKSTWKTGESAKISELLDRLLETENSELCLKERVWNLEKNGKEFQIKFVEAEKAQETLRNELRDQEELVRKIMALRTENDALSSRLQEAQVVVRRSSDIEQNESFMSCRIEELESCENRLKFDLDQAKQLISQKDRRIKLLETEMSEIRSETDESLSDINTKENLISSLKKSNEELKNEIKKLQEDLNTASNENLNCETQHRNEVAKMRNQLKLTNTQLTDLDSLNVELHDKVIATEQSLKKALNNLEENSSKFEKEMLDLNVQLSEKDSKIEQLELTSRQHSINVQGEMNYYALTSLMSLHQSLKNFIAASKNCENCINIEEHLNSLSDCLQVFNEALSQKNVRQQSDSELEDMSDSSLIISREDISTNSSDNNVNLADPSSDNIKSTKSLPAVPPRHRRGARKKKILRSFSLENCDISKCSENSIKNGSEPVVVPNCMVSGLIPNNSGCKLSENHNLEMVKLHDKIRSLKESLDRRNVELKIVNDETNQVYKKLQEKDDKLNKKTHEVIHYNETLENLRTQYLNTVQDYEKSKLDRERRHKIDLEKLSKSIEVLKLNAEKLKGNATAKDKLIDVLVKKILYILSPDRTSVVVNEIRRTPTKKNLQELPDYDVAKVCEVLKAQPHQGACGSDALSYKFPFTNRSKFIYSTSSYTTLNHEKPHSSTSILQSLPPIQLSKKSKIPRLMHLPIPYNFHSDCGSSGILLSYHKSISSRMSENTVNKSNSSARKFTVNKRKPFVNIVKPAVNNAQTFVMDQEIALKARYIEKTTGEKPTSAEPAKVLTQNSAGIKITVSQTACSRKTTAQIYRGTNFISQNSICTEKTTAKSENFSQKPTNIVNPAPNSTARSIKQNSGTMVKSKDAKTPLKALTKVPFQQRLKIRKGSINSQNVSEEKGSKIISDARKIKRMITGLVPINAKVDCSSAPEWKNDHFSESSCVPKPQDLQITRRVGIDGAVIAWRPLEHDCIAGFQIIVGGKVVQNVRSPNRNKALVTGLPFPSPFTIGLVAISHQGQCSVPAAVSHEMSSAYKAPNQVKKIYSTYSCTTSPYKKFPSPKTSMPTCI